MKTTKWHILVTGRPGVGKTTLARRVVDGLTHLRPVGFYTAEIRERGVRKGFELIDLGGHRGRLAHVDVRGPHRVGKYGVDVEGFDRLLDAINWSGPGAGLVVIDEIGKMECFSETFRTLVRQILDSDTHMFATVALRGGGLIAEVKERPDVELVELTPSSRDSLTDDVLKHFAQ